MAFKTTMILPIGSKRTSIQTTSRFFSVAISNLILFSFVALATAGPYDAPTSYYNSATSTGTTLKSQLNSILTSGHIQRNYGNFRDSAEITDADPNSSGDIILVYDRDSVDAEWDSGNTWNREHVWPQSRQPGSASNGTSGNLGDPHALRPSTPSVNSNRGNDPFGFAASTGSYGSSGSSFFPGDTDKGDIARSLFYSDTRWGPEKGLSLVNGTPSGNQMGELNSLVAWHYLDTPDEFEQRRNHAIYSPALNPFFYTNNRNAFVDHPEYVWSIYQDQQNDTTLGLAGTTVASNGSSTLDVDLGRVYVGGSTPSNQNVTLNKAGNDGTYYEVTANGNATSSVEGRYNAFAMGGSGSKTINVGLTTSTATAGLKTGSVVIDNLDVTTSGGTGNGANDGDDTIDLSFAVLSHPDASFSESSLLTTTTLDFGTVSEGSGTLNLPFSIANYDGAGAPTFASNIDLDSILGSDDTSILSTNLASFDDLVQGDTNGFMAMFDTSVAGNFTATYQLTLSGEDLPGEQTEFLTLSIMGIVEAAGLDGDYNDDGTVDAADYTVWRDSLGSTTMLEADGDGSGTIDTGDYAVWVTNYGTSSSSASANSVPEPGAALLLLLGLSSFVTRRNQ